MTNHAGNIHQASGSAGDSGRTVAYIAGVFPTYSETFVYREILELRRRGWRVEVCSLNQPTQSEMRGLSELQSGVLGVYGSSGATGAKALAECLLHPLRAASTLFQAASDACFAG